MWRSSWHSSAMLSDTSCMASRTCKVRGEKLNLNLTLITISLNLILNHKDSLNTCSAYCFNEQDV